ncbi:MAG: type II secretion system protein [Armatimonadetes bacterium]|nr:type II secretion system protein [Armatimonadota bacterium]
MVVKRTRAFTLLELITVIAIIAVVSSLLFAAFSQAKASAKSATCLSNLSQIGKAINLYMNDNDDVFPNAVDFSDRAVPTIWDARPDWEARIADMPLFEDLLFPYVKTRAVFHCPLDTGFSFLDANYPTALNARPSAFSAFGSSYLLRTEFVFTAQTGTSTAAPADVNLVFDASGAWHGSGGPLSANLDDSSLYRLLRGYRYNVLYADYHAKNVTWRGLGHAWSVRL